LARRIVVELDPNIVKKTCKKLYLKYERRGKRNIHYIKKRVDEMIHTYILFLNA